MYTVASPLLPISGEKFLHFYQLAYLGEKKAQMFKICKGEQKTTF